MIIGIQECANGNESVGSMWLETKVFDDKTPISAVWDWSCKVSNPQGKLILSKPQNSDTKEDSQNDTQQLKAKIRSRIEQYSAEKKIDCGITENKFLDDLRELSAI